VLLVRRWIITAVVACSLYPLAEVKRLEGYPLLLFAYRLAGLAQIRPSVLPTNPGSTFTAGQPISELPAKNLVVHRFCR
jgi:hypothetical protein